MGKFMDFMDTKGGGAAIGTAGNFFDATIGAIAHNQRETQEANRQKEFMQIQKQNQMDLNRQGQELAMQTWNDTNYGAQMEHIKEAGLNPAMLYGKGGAGGATTSAGSGGSAQAGKAPQAKTMDIGNTAQSAAQLSLLGAQRENIEADTHNKMKSGDNQYEQSELREKENRIEALYGMDAKIAEASNRKDKAITEGQILFDGATGKNAYGGNTKYGDMYEQELNDKIESYKQRREEVKLVQQQVDTSKALEGLTTERKRQVYHAIIQDYAKIGMDGVKAVIGLVGKGTPVKQAIETVTKTKYSKDGPKGIEHGHSTTTRTQR